MSSTKIKTAKLAARQPAKTRKIIEMKDSVIAFERRRVNDVEDKLQASTRAVDSAVRSLDNALSDVAALRQRDETFVQRSTTMIDSLLQERTDLLSRMIRIDQRLEVLGYGVDEPVLQLMGKSESR